jgi:hypothetical protein
MATTTTTTTTMTTTRWRRGGSTFAIATYATVPASRRYSTNSPRSGAASTSRVSRPWGRVFPAPSTITTSTSAARRPSSDGWRMRRSIDSYSRRAPPCTANRRCCRLRRMRDCRPRIRTVGRNYSSRRCSGMCARAIRRGGAC